MKHGSHPDFFVLVDMACGIYMYIFLLLILTPIGRWIRSRSIDVTRNEGFPVNRWISWGRYTGWKDYYGPTHVYVVIRLPGSSFEYSPAHDLFMWGKPFLIWVSGLGWKHGYNFDDSWNEHYMWSRA